MNFQLKPRVKLPHQLLELTGKASFAEAFLAATEEQLKTCTTGFLLGMLSRGEAYWLENFPDSYKNTPEYRDFQLKLRDVLSRRPHRLSKFEAKLVRKEMIRSKCAKPEAIKRVAQELRDIQKRLNKRFSPAYRQALPDDYALPTHQELYERKKRA